jgi:hypothetical protein
METRPQDYWLLWKLVTRTIGYYGNSSANTRVCFSQKQWRLPPQIQARNQKQASRNKSLAFLFVCLNDRAASEKQLLWRDRRVSLCLAGGVHPPLGPLICDVRATVLAERKDTAYRVRHGADAT